MRHCLFLFLFLLLAVTLTAAGGPHTLQRGETFADVAKLYKIPLDSLLAANPGVEAYAGLTIEVPVETLLYDVGDSGLFRLFRNPSAMNLDKREKVCGEAIKMRDKYGDIKDMKKKEQLKRKALELFEEAAKYGDLKALYELGRYKVHGRLYGHDRLPDFIFCNDVNSDVTEFKDGIECLQIAALHGNRESLVELAMACGYKKSPIWNPYLCLGLLEFYKRDLNLDVNDMLRYMYENGHGIEVDYLKAYLCCEPTKLVYLHLNDSKSPREKLLDKIEMLPEDFESAKYGVGLDSMMLFTIGLSHFHDSILEPEGAFWVHRAAHAGNADACWFLAWVFHEKYFRDGEIGDYGFESEGQMLYFARKAAEYGNKDAESFLEAYEEEERQRKERIEQRELAIQEAKRERRRQRWNEVLGVVFQTAAQVAVQYAAIESQNAYSANVSGSMPQMSALQMSDAQWMARNELAMRQIMQYTANQVNADWTGTPMVPTDMSAVNLGTDMSPGSPLWMWRQQQVVNRMSTVNARMSWERIAFYRRQADMVEQRLRENPLQPVAAGVFDNSGNWISYEMIAAENSFKGESAKTERTDGYDKIRSEAVGYFKQRYGDTDCPQCVGGVCRTCNGTGLISNSLGASGHTTCPNCWKEHGVATGRCGKCQGKGVVYGLK